MLGLMVLYTLGGMWLLRVARLRYCARPESVSADPGRANIPKGGRFATARAVSTLIGHGGIAGAIVEASVALGVVGVRVWLLRERRRGHEPGIEEHGGDSDGRR